MATKPLLILGTGNRKKGLELVKLFKPVGLQILTLADVENPIEVDETGTTFAENGALKATEQARHLGRWVLGEDSGLAIDYLKGEPGVYSARYSQRENFEQLPGESIDDANNRLVIERVKKLPPEKRSARFVCHMSLSDPEGNIRAESEAFCRGRILLELDGDHGFGYDPLFEIVEYHRSFARLGPVVKSCLSHRARAAAAIIPQMTRLVDSGQWS
jgi:XTP/dITP diphosphohydrolase